MANPKQLSKRRSICSGCKYKTKRHGNDICGACGCPLSAKQRTGTCPKGFFNKSGTGSKEKE